ncbi:MAG: cytoskeletal protein RodZ, partial [Acidobacteria bacterium]|nr:cytoskeletal protein RodZ [Acidobacteriota bacterium]
AAPEGAGAAPAGGATAPAGAAMAPAGAAMASAGAATAPAGVGAGQTAATPAAAQVPEGAVRLTLAATGPCWVSLRSDGQIVFAGLMQAGDRREFDVKGSISLTAGDAATLAFTVNGEQGRSLGGSGAVATVRFSPDTFRSVLAGR